MASSAQKMNRVLLNSPYGNSGSLRSIVSNNSSISYMGEVHSNPTFDGTESIKEDLNESHEYESIINRTAVGPRRKMNFIYEKAQASPSPPLRVRQTTESESSSRGSSTSSSDSLPKKSDTAPLGKTALFTLLFSIFAISVAALVLVILIITGSLEGKCGCTQGGAVGSPRTEMSGEHVQNLRRKIQDLERSVRSLKITNDKMKHRQSNTDSLVSELENQVESLQKQVFKQRALLNETAKKVSFVDGSAEKNLDTKIRLLNNALTSKVDELWRNHTQTVKSRDSLRENVTQLQARVQELKKSSRNISTRAESLEQKYADVIHVVKTLAEVNEAQNSTHESLRLSFMNLKDAMVTINTTLTKEKLGSACEYKFKKGTPVSSGADASVSYPQPVDKRVVGVACSTDNAREFKLLDKSSQKGLYECKCSGIAQSADNAKRLVHCYIHVWECPIHT